MANDLLKGKRGIIFGALNSQSIAWKVAERAHEEGATFVLTNAPIAMRMGEINNLHIPPRPNNQGFHMPLMYIACHLV